MQQCFAHLTPVLFLLLRLHLLWFRMVHHFDATTKCTIYPRDTFKILFYGPNKMFNKGQL